MRRLILFAISAVAAVSALTVPVLATDTMTTHIKGGTDSFVDTLCVGGSSLYDIDVTFNQVLHETMTATGAHFTFTETGRFVAQNLDTGETFRGHYTVWAGFNENPGGALAGTFTFSARGVGDQGSRLNVHELDHFNMTPGLKENAFFRQLNCD